MLATVVQLEAPVTVRALARHAGVAPQTALTVINDLADAGIVSAEAAGRAQIVSLDREHLLAEPLIALSRTRARLIERLGSELAGWSGLAGAWLFGTRISFAGLVRDENRLVTAIREEGIALTPGSAKLLKVAA